jgi:hypothetical protein
MDLSLPPGVEANFGAVPKLGELGVVTFARDLAGYLHQLHRTPRTVDYREEAGDAEGPQVAPPTTTTTTHLVYQLPDRLAEVTIHRDGTVVLTVDGREIDLPFSPRDLAWAIAWRIHLDADQPRDTAAGLSDTSQQ